MALTVEEMMKLDRPRAAIVDDPFPAGLDEQIEDFLGRVHPKLTPGMDLYPELYESGFFPLQRMGEAALMLQAARAARPRVVMEIGADKGGGVYQWCQSLRRPDGDADTIIACEIRGTPYARAFEKAFPGKRFFWMQESSLTRDAARRVRDFLRGRPIDCLFIDGDKSFFALDFKLYAPLLSPNAIVFMHDVTDPEPGKSFAECREKYDWEILLNTADVQAALANMRLGKPPANAHEGWLRHWRGRSCGVGVIRIGGKPA